MSPKLHNYLRTYRKRCGFSQSDVAFLLGCQYGTKVSRYERQIRIPSATTLIALEVVYQVPARDLFAGLYEEVAGQVARRAKLLEKQHAKLLVTPSRRQKIDSTQRIISAADDAH